MPVNQLRHQVIEHCTIESRPRARLILGKYSARTSDKLLVDLMGMPTMHFGRRGRSPPRFKGRRCRNWRFPIGTSFGGSHHNWFSMSNIANLTADAAGNQKRFDHGSISVSPARPITGAVMPETKMQARNLKKICDGSLLPTAEGCHEDFLRTCLQRHNCGGCGLLQQALWNGLYRFMTESARQ